MSDRIDELVRRIRLASTTAEYAADHEAALTELATIARDEWKKPRSCPSCGEYMVHIDTAEIIQQETAEYVLRAREAEARAQEYRASRPCCYCRLRQRREGVARRIGVQSSRSPQAREGVMLYQDRRALKCVRNRIMWVASLVVSVPLAAALPPTLLAVAALSASAALIVAYVTLLVSITH